MLNRKHLTELETKYYIRQIVQGVAYLHLNKVIHRDLKLENLFLDDKMRIQIGDFGLSIKISHKGERRSSICGTPNYLSPEVLNPAKYKGHSLEADIWAIGVIAYILL